MYREIVVCSNPFKVDINCVVLSYSHPVYHPSEVGKWFNYWGHIVETQGKGVAPSPPLVEANGSGAVGSPSTVVIQLLYIRFGLSSLVCNVRYYILQ